MSENKQEEEKAPMNLSSQIVQRFMSPDDFNQFIEAYRRSRKSQSSHLKDRASNLSQKLSDRDMEILNAYLFENETTLAELDARFGLKSGNTRSKALVVAVKYLFQNREIAGL